MTTILKNNRPLNIFKSGTRLRVGIGWLYYKILKKRRSILLKIKTGNKYYYSQIHADLLEEILDIYKADKPVEKQYKTPIKWEKVEYVDTGKQLKERSKDDTTGKDDYW